ncbi:34752_t:CDS:2 [Gigaspora margarita]|uniref:34752_t:CDS:1 n=1 Tax=Gigaspora margarita TaxID=4874 RepID=A0ABN7VZ96_GIGMA|nr:34752_t:CDS:2 [Gigaspora margarita]
MTYINEIHQLPDYIIAKGFLVNQFKADLFVNIDSIEDAQQWLVDFEEVFENRHSLASALYTYEDSFHLLSNNEQELIQLLADCAINPNHSYVSNLFKQFCNNYLGEKNGTSMFQ